MKLLKEIDAKNTVGIDMIPTNSVKIAVHVLCSPLFKAIINSLLQGVFPNDAKIALVSPLDKGTSKKNEISNFRSVSILTTFLKKYEKVTKRFLGVHMSKLSSPFFSSYRKNYSVRHVLVRLAEEWRERLDNNYVIESVFVGL